jgi:hypothetical protein
MPNTYYPFLATTDAQKPREDGLRTGMLRYLVVEKDGRRHQHSVESLKRAELGEIIDALGYNEDRKLMKEPLMAAEESEEAVKVYLTSMREMIAAHFEEALEEIKNAGENAESEEEIGGILIVPPHMTLDEVVDTYLARKNSEIIENSNNEKTEDEEEEDEEQEEHEELVEEVHEEADVDIE